MTAPTASQRLTRLAPLSEIHAWLGRIVPVVPRTIDAAAASGKVLAADVTVPAPVPLAAIALRDGWAVRAEAVADAGPYAPQPLEPAPRWVEAGAPLPARADAVLAPDALVIAADGAQAIGTAASGEDVLGAGADAGLGLLLRHAGERLRGIDIAVLRAAGIPHVQVRAPRVRVFSSNPRIDAVDDTVAPLIARGVEACGGVAIVERATPNGDRTLADALRADDVDAAIVIGGTGSGRHDRSVLTLAEVGRVDMHGLGVRPGETAALGAVASRPLLLVPGRIDGALAVWLVVGRALLARLTGWRGDEPTLHEKLARKIVSTIGVAEVIPVRRGAAGLEPLASGYFPISALAAADGWVLVAPESEGYPAGSMVEMKPLP